MNALERSDMKIEQPDDNYARVTDSLYVTIGNFTYYFDDSIDGEAIVKRWHTDDDTENLESSEVIQS